MLLQVMAGIDAFPLHVVPILTLPGEGLHRQGRAALFTGDPAPVALLAMGACAFISR